MREINCFKCNRKVGVIRDASLMKNLKYICPSCQDDISQKIQENNIMDSLYSFVTKNDKHLDPKF
jgi:phage FluMu protein Com